MPDKAHNRSVAKAPAITSKQSRQRLSRIETNPTGERSSAEPIIEQAQHSPQALTPRGVIQLQRAVGNRAVSQLVKTQPTTPLIQRRIVIGPNDFLRGLNVDLQQATKEQIKEYIRIAVWDDYQLALKLADKKAQEELPEVWKRLMSKKTPQEQVPVLADLIKLVNSCLDAQNISNRATRYATMPGEDKGKTEKNATAGLYDHTSLTTGKSEGVKWGSDDAMWSQMATGLGQGLVKDSYEKTSPRNVKELLPLRQLAWAEAKRLFPRPLINLIFDVRYQLETQATIVDERTPDQLARKDKSPNEWGTLRSWHQDSVGVLPATGYNAKAVPPHATNLHQHYTQNSQVGAGSSIGSGVSGPQGLAEYTGTGSNWEHNTKIVLDYINKRVYLTLTHYQYWALVNRQGKYEFWNSGTQKLGEAQGNLQKACLSGGKLAGATDIMLMSPWMEIVMPTAGGLIKSPFKETPSKEGSTQESAPPQNSPGSLKDEEVSSGMQFRRIGDCLYDAVNAARDNPNSNVDAYRKMAHQWYITNLHDYPDLAEVADFDETVEVLTTPGAWTGNAGDLSPLILASSLGITLTIVTPSAVHVYPPLGGASLADVMVFYDANHYTDGPREGHAGWEQLDKKTHTLKKSSGKSSVQDAKSDEPMQNVRTLEQRIDQNPVDEIKPTPSEREQAQTLLKRAGVKSSPVVEVQPEKALSKNQLKTALQNNSGGLSPTLRAMLLGIVIVGLLAAVITALFLREK